MSTTLRLVGSGSEPVTPLANAPLTRAEHDQKYILRNVDRELQRLGEGRPDLRERFAAIRDEFAKSVEQRGTEFRQAGGRNYLDFAQGLARMRRELSSSVRELVQQPPSSGGPMDVVPLLPQPRGRLDVRG